VDPGPSVAFVEVKGTELEKARMRRVLYGVDPTPDVVRPLTERQNDDGGFPRRGAEGSPSCVHGTLNALWQMDELGALGGPVGDKALRYLLAVQREDGGWDEDASVAECGVPPWARPGDLRARLYLTAYAAYWLVLGGRAGHEAFGRALRFLQSHQDETGRFHGFIHTTWIATSVFVMAGSQYADVVAKGLQALVARPLPEWVDSQICWALDCLGRAGVLKDQPIVQEGLAELLRRRGADGEWASEDGAAHAAGATVEALKVLKHYGLLEAA